MNTVWVISALICGFNSSGAARCTWKDVMAFKTQSLCIQALQNGARNVRMGQAYVIAECRQVERQY
jgi:hypothetical protein